MGGFLRSMMLMAAGFLAVKAMKSALESIEAQKVKVKAKAEEAEAKIQRLKLDPVTGVYRPEA